MKIFLIGYRCVGKTVTGKLLAEMMRFAFIDTDKEIEKKMGNTIASIVKKKGWKYFRNIESQILREIAIDNKCIIATGGGIILDFKNIKFMKKNGTIVWLKASSNIILKRMKKSLKILRPSLTGRKIEHETESVLIKRIPLYKECADFIVDTSINEIKSVAKEIKRKINNVRQ